MKTTIISGHDKFNFAARQFLLDLAENPAARKTHVFCLAEAPFGRSWRNAFEKISEEWGLSSAFDCAYLQGLSGTEACAALSGLLGRAEEYLKLGETVCVYIENPLRWLLKCPAGEQKSMRRRMRAFLSSANRTSVPLMISLKLNSLLEYQGLYPRGMSALTSGSAPDDNSPVFFLLPSASEIYYEQISAAFKVSGENLDGDELMCLLGTGQALISSCPQWLGETAAC